MKFDLGTGRYLSSFANLFFFSGEIVVFYVASKFYHQ